MSRNLFTALDAVLPVYFPSVLVRLLVNNGYQEEKLLLGTELSAKDFEDENRRISFTTLRQLILNALETTADDGLGEKFGEQINVTSLGMLGYAAMSCKTLEESLTTIIEFFRIRDPLYVLSLCRDGLNQEEAAIQIDEAIDFADIRFFLYSSAIAGASAMLRFQSGRDDLILRKEYACPQLESNQTSACSSKLKEKVPSIYNAPYTRLVFKAEALSLPLPTADPLTARSTRQICQTLLSKLDNQHGLLDEVKSYLLNQGRPYPSLDEAAHHFCLSSRSFRRSLQQSGTTYQKLLDKVREAIAIELLATTQKPIQQIAYELGFNDPSNFGRAFKRWTGKPPGDLRQ